MADIFNISEIFEIALQMEKNGSAFYKKAAENTSIPAAKELLLKFAEMEDHHFVTFEKMKLELIENISPENFDYESDEARYLQSLVNRKIFDEKGVSPSELTDSQNLLGVFEKAISLEVDSVMYYLGIKAFVPEKYGKNKIEDIISEEMKHITYLSEAMLEYR